MSEAGTFQINHVTASKVLTVRSLNPGETVKEGDLYKSTSGVWEPAPCPGVRISDGCDTVWVRPVDA